MKLIRMPTEFHSKLDRWKPAILSGINFNVSDTAFNKILYTKCGFSGTECIEIVFGWGSAISLLIDWGGEGNPHSPSSSVHLAFRCPFQF